MSLSLPSHPIRTAPCQISRFLMSANLMRNYIHPFHRYLLSCCNQVLHLRVIYSIESNGCGERTSSNLIFIISLPCCGMWFCVQNYFAINYFCGRWG